LKQTQVKSRGFSAIVIRSEFNSPFRQREAHRRNVFSLYLCFDASISWSLSRNRETMSSTYAQRTLDPVIQWPRSAPCRCVRTTLNLFFITLHVWKMNEYTYDENEENDTSTVSNRDGSTRIRCQSNNMTTNCRRFQLGCLTS